MKLIDKDTLVAEIDEKIKGLIPYVNSGFETAEKEAVHKIATYENVKEIIDTLEVKNPYEQIVQYDSIKAGIQAHAETYSFNIESLLFNQLTKEQQALWRKEIEQACISGGEVGYELARDPRYKENLEVKEVDLKKEIEEQCKKVNQLAVGKELRNICRHFYELGLKAQKVNIVMDE